MTYIEAEKRLYNTCVANIEAVNRELVRVYVKAQKELLVMLVSYQKRAIEDRIPAQEFRINALYQQIDAEIDKVFTESLGIIRNGYVANFEIAYYNHAYNIERAVNLDLTVGNYALNFPVLPVSAIETVLNESLGGFKLVDRWGEITANAKYRMRGLVAEAITKGDTLKKLAAELKSMDGWVDGYVNRSMVVARTEMLRAYSYGSDEARKEAEAAGVEFQYKWSSLFDARTRDDHVIMNGRPATITDGEPVFTLPDGSKGAGPRMSGLSAKEVINCRCRRLDLPYGIEPTSRSARLPDGDYVEIPFNENAQAWIEKNYGKKFKK